MVIVNFDDLKIVPSMPFDFRTHLNYISCMNELSKNLELRCTLNIDTKSLFKVASLKKKIRLICLIKESLDEEYKRAAKEKEFAKVCSMWIPVKSYYLIFNMLLIIHVLMNSNETNLNYTHAETINKFRGFLKSKTLKFNREEFNIVNACGEAFLFKSDSGDTLKREVSPELRAKSVLKKLCKYKLEDFCRYKGIKNFIKKKDRLIRDSFFKDSKISLFEFFYWYRIKTNYRDLAFLDQEVYEEDIAKFYENYYSLTINFYECLKKLINELSKKRLGEEIL